MEEKEVKKNSKRSEEDIKEYVFQKTKEELQGYIDAVNALSPELIQKFHKEEDEKAKEYKKIFSQIPKGEAGIDPEEEKAEQKSEKEDEKKKDDEKNERDLTDDSVDVDDDLPFGEKTEKDKEKNPDDVFDDPDDLFNDGVIDVEGKEGEEAKEFSAPVSATMYFKEYESGMPYLSVETVEKAIEAMNALEEVRDAYRPVLVCCIDDDGTKKMYRTYTIEEAKKCVEEEINDYLSAHDTRDRSKEVYIDEGTGPGIYEPTPLEYVNDDESYKGESEAEGLIRVYKGDMYSVVFHKDTGKVARWDIYDLEQASIYTGNPEEDYAVTDEDRKRYKFKSGGDKKKSNPLSAILKKLFG